MHIRMFARRWMLAIVAFCALGAGCGRGAEPRKLTGKDVMTPVKAAAGPLRVSTTNPRYFETPAGEMVYLAGTHTWSNLQDWGATNPPPVFNFNGFVDFLVAQGQNVMRMHVWEQASGIPWSTEQVWVAPLPYERTGPGTAFDGGPKLDLTKWDEKYFDRLRSRVRQAERRGIYVSVMLFNGLSVTFRSWKGHPFNAANNINAIEGDTNRDGEGEEVHTLANPAITSLQQAYVTKVVETIGDLGNVLWEIGDVPQPASLQWQSAMVKSIAETESRLEEVEPHPIGLTVQSHDGDTHILFGKVVVDDLRMLSNISVFESRVWRTFLGGQNPLVLDPYRTSMIHDVPMNREPATDPRLQNRSNNAWWPVRKSLGYTRWFASRLDLKTMTPRPELASTIYCLADPGRAYLIYLPAAEGAARLYGWWGHTVEVDLSGVSGTFSTEWFDPTTASFVAGPEISGGARRAIRSPFGNLGAVLHITARRAASPAN